MRKIPVLCSLLLLIPALALPARAQDPPKPPDTATAPEPPAHYYHLEFVVQEVGADGKPTNTRNYSAIVCTGKNQQFSAIRTGLRLPIITGAYHGPNAPSDSKLEYQFQYIDVGVSIDTQDVREVGHQLAIHQLAIHLKTEISSVAESASTSVSGQTNDPVIRQNSWQASVIIPVGKPTVAFSSDALDSKGSMQLVVTATPLQ
jgi:hypothetical protein